MAGVEIKREVDYPATPDEVLALYTDPAALERKFTAIGARSFTLTSRAVSASAAALAWHRTMSAEVPGVAAKVIPSEQTLDELHAWERRDDGWRGEVEVKISGTPVRMAGEILLTAAEGGCHQEVRLEITVKVPLIGGRIAGMVAQSVEASIAAEMAWNARELGGAEG